MISIVEAGFIFSGNVGKHLRDAAVVIGHRRVICDYVLSETPLYQVSIMISVLVAFASPRSRVVLTLALLCVIEGTGIVMLKNPDGTFNQAPPCAVGLTGMGFGLLAGASVKDVVMFLMDDQTVNSFTSENGLKIGSQLELTVGIGRTGKGDFDITGRGVGVPISIAYTKGAFAGFNLEGAVLGARHAANKAFYGQTTTPRDIIIEKRYPIPADKVTMLPEVYDKLDKLSKGVEAEPAPAEEEKKSVAAAEAEKASASIHAEEGADVVHVDAAAEAAKEAAA